MNTHKPAEELTFEQALQELEAIVRELEGGQGDLDASIAQYERGTSLKKHCMDKLEAARMKVEKVIQQAESGTLHTEPMDSKEA